MRSESLHSLTLLLIADNIPSATVRLQRLQESGHIQTVERVNTVEEGIQCLKESSIDVIIYDHDLPDKPEEHSFEKLVQHAGFIPIIVLTSLENEIRSTEIIKLGAQEVLVKSQFDLSTLLRSIQHSIERKKYEKETVERTKQAEQSLDSSTDMFRQIFNKCPLPVLIYDVKTLAFLEVNERALSKYGYSREEFLKMTAYDIRPVEEREAFEKEITYLLKNDKLLRKNWTHLKKNGERMLVEIDSYRFDFNGKDALLVHVTDHTDSKELKNRLDILEKQKKWEIIKAVLNTEERERTKIGEELHDNVNQIFATAKLFLEIALNREREWKEYLLQSKEIINLGIEEIRKLSKDLVTPSFEQAGLVTTIEDQVKIIQDARGIQFTLYKDGFDEGRLMSGHKVMLYRIIQEQFNNILKHSKANNVEIKLELNDQKVLLQIEDNGKGFDTLSQKQGIGINNMKSRVSFYDGRVDINSEPGKGTRLQVEFVVNNQF